MLLSFKIMNHNDALITIFILSPLGLWGLEYTSKQKDDHTVKVSTRFANFFESWVVMSHLLLNDVKMVSNAQYCNAHKFLILSFTINHLNYNPVIKIGTKRLSPLCASMTTQSFARRWSTDITCQYKNIDILFISFYVFHFPPTKDFNARIFQTLFITHKFPYSMTKGLIILLFKLALQIHL